MKDCIQPLNNSRSAPFLKTNSLVWFENSTYLFSINLTVGIYITRFSNILSDFLSFTKLYVQHDVFLITKNAMNFNASRTVYFRQVYHQLSLKFI